MTAGRPGADSRTSELRVLAIEPFYGGSHRAFLDGWVKRSRHRFDLVTFPDRHWKWRMRHGALSAAREVQERTREGQEWDVVWASDMLDLAAFRGLCREVAAVPTVLYFHENQLTYPWREAHSDLEPSAGRDVHYAYTNYLSALAADRIWFNSAFHRDQWLTALGPFLGRFPDHQHRDGVEQLAGRSEVQTPGVDGRGVDGPEVREGGVEEAEAFDVVWAARWEHDKNPGGFFEALRAWRRDHPEHWGGANDFGGPTPPVRLHVLGQSYDQAPDCFGAARREFDPFIESWGHVPRDDYHRCLERADVFVSTARHEFFGISAVEAMIAGAHPVLPRRLSYPELVAGEDDALVGPVTGPLSETEEAGAFAGRLAALFEARIRGALGSRSRWRRVGARYRWAQRVVDLDQALVRAVTPSG